MHFQGNVLYEWNNDGLSEYKILNVMQHMLVYSNACHIHQWGQEHTVLAITAEFTGQLNGWWNDNLSEIQLEEITKAIKRDEYWNPALNERGEVQGECVHNVVEGHLLFDKIDLFGYQITHRGRLLKLY